MGGLGLILGVDQILERFRTVLNVTGDLAACTVMNRHVEGHKELEEELRESAHYEAVQRAEEEDVIVSTSR